MTWLVLASGGYDADAAETALAAIKLLGGRVKLAVRPVAREDVPAWHQRELHRTREPIWLIVKRGRLVALLFGRRGAAELAAACRAVNGP